MIDMRVLVAVFSHSFNTLKVGNAIKEAMGADLTRIEPVRNWPLPVKMIMAKLGMKTAIRSGKTDLKSYDLLVLCSPVWTNSPPPAVNRYIADLSNAGGRKFAIVTTSERGHPEKAEGKIRASLARRGMQHIGSLGVSKKEIDRGEHFQKAADFAGGLQKAAMLPFTVTEVAQKVSRFITLLQMMARFIGK